MLTVEQRIEKLKKRIDIIENGLQKIINEIAQTKNTNIGYWTNKKAEISRLYEKARIVFADFLSKEYPKTIKPVVTDQLKRIKKLNIEVPNINTKNIVDSKSAQEFLLKAQKESLTTFLIAVDNGQKNLYRLVNYSQQLAVSEYELNERIEQGVRQGTFKSVTRDIRDKLLKDASEGKTVQIVDKNGNPRNYNIKDYAEMVIRTKTAEIQTNSVLNTARSISEDLVQVSSHNTKTPYDAQFEGKIFSISGTDRDFPPVIDLPPFHPNCIHRITVVIKEIMDIRGNLKEKSNFSNKPIVVPESRQTFLGA